MTKIVSKFVTEDGHSFDSRQEAEDHIRIPLITKALNELNGNNKELTEWLIAKREEVEATYESTKIRRVTKADRNKLKKALDAVVADNSKAFEFIVENADAILNSFRWPSVKRVDEAEQAEMIRKAFMTLTEENKELVDWLVANQNSVLEAFKAGEIKREINPKAQEALRQYRENRAAQKKKAEEAAAQAAQVEKAA